MEWFTSLVTTVQSFLWDGLLIVLLCGTGLFFTIRLKGIQLRRFVPGLKEMFAGFSLKGEHAGKHGMSSFQAVATAIAGQVGTGNLAGAATAILLGGPGAIFWMWASAFLGMATIYAEALLAQKFRTTDRDGQVVGGPAYYIEKGLQCKWLARIFAVLIVLALGFTGNMVQSNSIASAFTTSFGVPSWAGGLVIALMTGIILIGGIRRIASFTEKVVPVMALLYLTGGIVVLMMNAGRIPDAFFSIFRCAFQPVSAFGGVAGYTVMRSMKYGVARGLFSNEAGMGSTPHAHAVARVDPPCKQGHVAIVSVFFDTFVMLTLTALIILTSGVVPDMLAQGQEGIAVTQAAFSASFGSAGGGFIAVCLLFFAFSTIISWYYYGETNIRYLFDSHRAVVVYKLCVIAFVFAGSLFQANVVWALSDVFNGLMVIPNAAALLLLSPVVVSLCRQTDTRPLGKHTGNNR
ncbi:MAG: sodium:alanine symporter family protein [Clostridiales bacterium]|jgi:AGCS family alanine or glycine:cation symporter|nr:sodium:alanine symporter family protein [Clostridiales bacterium]